MNDNQLQKPEKKRPGRKQGVKIRHGAYSLIARGDLPDNRRYLREYLTTCREGLISDLGPKEEDLSTAQRILIDRVIGKLGVLRCLEEYARERGVIKEGKIFPPLEHNFLAWSNSLRLDLQALGIDKRAAAKVLDLTDYIKAKDAEVDVKEAAKIKAQAKTHAEVRVVPDQDQGRDVKDDPKQSSNEIQDTEEEKR